MCSSQVMRLECPADHLQMDKAAGTGQNTAIHSLVPVHFEVMTRSTPIRSALKYGVCALLNLALLGCSGNMLTVNIINHGPLLHSVAIHSHPDSRSAADRWGSKPHDFLPPEWECLVVVPNSRWA